MDSENIVYLHNGMLMSCKENWNYKMGGTGNYHSEWGNLDPERKMSSTHSFSSMDTSFDTLDMCVSIGVPIKAGN